MSKPPFKERQNLTGLCIQSTYRHSLHRLVELERTVSLKSNLAQWSSEEVQVHDFMISLKRCAQEGGPRLESEERVSSDV